MAEVLICFMFLMCLKYNTKFLEIDQWVITYRLDVVLPEAFSIMIGAANIAATNTVNMMTFFLRSLKYSSSVGGFFLGNPNPFILFVVRDGAGTAFL